jgi:hypothetical protein
MSESKHTPGPWLLHSGFLGYFGDVYVKNLAAKKPEDHHHVARLYAPKPERNPICSLDGSVQKREAIAVVEANARLVSICPEMYDYISTRAELGDKDAIALIAKAEGRS